MTTLLCLVRHGVTAWNYDGRAQGQSDIPLSAEGQRQAEALAARITQEPWDAIYSSTLSRAIQTAEAIARRIGHNVVQDARLVERSMGLAEGTTFAERIMRWPGKGWNELPGLETDEALAARAHEVLTEIAGRHPGQRVICVAHGALIAAFLKSLVLPGESAARSMHQRNTSVTRVLFDGAQFVQESDPDFTHILEEGIEYSGEKNRLRPSMLGALLGDRVPERTLEHIAANATAIESAWDGDRLVGFARMFTDGVLHGYVDIVAVLPGYDQVRQRLISRLEARYPDVTMTHVPLGLERAGD